MHIYYYGLSCFKVVAKPEGRGAQDVTVIFSPFDKAIGLRPPQGKADIVLIGQDTPAYNNASILRDDPMVLDMPGEYDVRGVTITGISAPADAHDGSRRGMTTIFTTQTEGITLCHLGALGRMPTTEELDAIGKIDILFLPVGDPDGVDPNMAEKVARAIEPKIIIPMHYKVKGLKTKLLPEKSFCDEIGSCPKERLAKLVIKEKDLEGGTMQVVLMDPQ